MDADLLIVGQGLAGTLLGWALERAGIPFGIADAGHDRAASRVAAGIVNPITGRRLVKSWRVETWLPAARETYREIEQAWGIALWHEMRVWRMFADDRERHVLADKRASGALGDYVGAGGADGFWIEGAAWVDVAALIAVARARWLAGGRLRDERVDLAEARQRYGLVIDCRGMAVGPTNAPPHESPGFESLPWRYSKGESLTLAIDGLVPDVVLNRGPWVLPTATGRAKAGATHERGGCDLTTTPAARAWLERSVAAMTGRPFTVIGQDAGIRVYVDDKRPVVGRHPTLPGLGVMNGLGAKGVLWGPALARQWAEHLGTGAAFDAEVDVARIARAFALPGPA